MFSFVGLIVQVAIIALIVVWLVNRNKSKSKLKSRAQRLTNIADTKEDVRMQEMMVEKGVNSVLRVPF